VETWSWRIFQLFMCQVFSLIFLFGGIFEFWCFKEKGSGFLGDYLFRGPIKNFFHFGHNKADFFHFPSGDTFKNYSFFPWFLLLRFFGSSNFVGSWKIFGYPEPLMFWVTSNPAFRPKTLPAEFSNVWLENIFLLHFHIFAFFCLGYPKISL